MIKKIISVIIAFLMLFDNALCDNVYAASNSIKPVDMVISYNYTGIIDEKGNVYYWEYDNYENEYNLYSGLSDVKNIYSMDNVDRTLKKNGELYNSWLDEYNTIIMDDVKYYDISEGLEVVIKNNGDLYYRTRYTDVEPTTFTKIMENVKMVKVKYGNIVILNNNNELYTMGSNRSGQIGNGKKVESEADTWMDQATPYKVLDNVVDFDLDFESVAAVTQNGDLYFWGESCLSDNKYIPTIRDKDAKRVLVGGRVGFTFLKNDGDLYEYGWHEQIEDDGEWITHENSRKILDDVRVLKKGCNDGSFAAITTDDALYCWGYNDEGQVGIGGKIEEWYIYNPQKILENVDNVYLSKNDKWTGVGAVTKDNKIYRWGNNTFTNDTSKMVESLWGGKKEYASEPILIDFYKISSGKYTTDSEGDNFQENGGGTTGEFKDESDSEIKIGQKVKFTVPDSIPVIGGGDIGLDFDTIPIQFVKDGNTFKLGIGSKNLLKMSEEQWFSWKKFVETQNDDIKKGLNSFIASKFGTASMGWSVKPSISCYGYLEGTITSKGVESAGGEMVIEIKAKANKDWQTMVVVVPVVIKASGEFGAKADVEVGLDFEKSRVYTKGTLTLTLPKIKLSAGVGVAYIADISVYGSATNELEITASNSTKADVTATLKGELGVSAKVLFAEYEKKLLSGDWQYYSSSGNSKKKAASTKSKGLSTFGIDKDDEYTIKRENQSNWTNSDNSTTIENTVVLNDVYHSAQPQIVQTDSGKKILVYTADIDTRSTGNHTAVVYSVYDESTKKWSEPTIIDDDGTADFYPSVAVNGENVYVVWSNSDKAFTAVDVSDENFITKVASSLDIELATINLSNNNVSKKKLNTNDKMDINASVAINNGNVYVGWIENENNDIYELTGKNNIYISDIGEGTKKLHTSEDSQIISMAVGNLEDEVCIAYAVDEDSDLFTKDDINLCMGNLSGNTDVVGTGYYNNIQFAKVSGTESILCYTNNNDGTASISCSDEWWELGKSLNNDVVITSDYRYVEGKDSDLLICSSDKEGDGDGTDVFAYVIKDGNVSEVVNVIDNNGYTRNVSGIYSGGDYILAYTCTDVNMDVENVDESTDLCISKIRPSKNLKMEGISYNPEEVQPGEKMDVAVNVKNNGLQSDSNYVVQVLFGTEVIGETTIKDILNVGEEATTTVSVNIPEDFKLGTNLTFRVIASDGRLISEGSVIEKVGKADLQLEINKTNNTVDVSVKNTTAFDCGATLYIKDTDTDGKVYKTYNIGRIKGNDFYEFPIDKKELDSLEEGNVNLFFEVVADQEELFYSNNTGYVYIECSHTSTKTISTKATSSKAGKKVVVCNSCGKTISSNYIPKIGGISLSKATYVYDGKVKKPSVSVKDSSGKTISTSNYSVSYSNNVNVGKATVKVTFKGDYSGSLTKTYTINPKGTAIKGKLTAKKKKIDVKWNKVSKQTSGYQIQYSTNKKFTKKTTKTKIVKASKKKLTIKKLKTKKKYYVRIRTYKTVGGTKYYSTWSKSKSIKIK